MRIYLHLMKRSLIESYHKIKKLDETYEKFKMVFSLIHF